jgi:outer membrane protein insertion porin family
MLGDQRVKPLSIGGVGILCFLATAWSVGTISAQGPAFPSQGPPIPQPPPTSGGETQPVGTELVADVRIQGNETVSSNKVYTYLRTRKDRVFDPEVVQADKRRLAATGMFRDVRIYTQRSAAGVVVTFEVFERPTIRHIRFIGNRGFSDKSLLKESGLKTGEALNVYSVEEARRKVETLYQTKGYPKAQVTVSEGKSPEDRGAVFYISEGPLQRIISVGFIGNTIASDSRLKTKIKSKPGFGWILFGGKVDHAKIDEDIDRLTSYYRSLGFFRARIGRRLDYDDEHKWLNLKFVIDEGPRYVIRNVSVAGSERFTSEVLAGQLELTSGDYFNLDRMNVDVNTLRDVYGSQGFIFADIRADPRFLEEPGQLDLVYSVDEGNQFRVGRINVHIAGEFPHTQESVVLDRLSIRPGDIVDIREVRASERRLKSSQLFVVNPAEGNPPRIVIRPPDLSDAEAIAQDPNRPSIRGQNPEQGTNPRKIDLDIYVTPTPERHPSQPQPQDQQR